MCVYVTGVCSIGSSHPPTPPPTSSTAAALLGQCATVSFIIIAGRFASRALVSSSVAPVLLFGFPPNRNLGNGVTARGWSYMTPPGWGLGGGRNLKEGLELPHNSISCHMCVSVSFLKHISDLMVGLDFVVGGNKTLKEEI